MSTTDVFNLPIEEVTWSVHLSIDLTARHDGESNFSGAI